jgi:hypothetical protein
MPHSIEIGGLVPSFGGFFKARIGVILVYPDHGKGLQSSVLVEILTPKS